MVQRTAVVGLTVASSAHLLGARLSLLADDGWEVYLVVGDSIGLPADLDSRVEVIQIRMRRSMDPLGDIVSLWRWWRLLRALRPNLVFAATPKAALLAMLSARGAGVPRRVFEVWGARWDRMTGFRATLLRWADRCASTAASCSVAVSPSLATLMVTGAVSRQEPIVMNHWGSRGVDLELFTPAVRTGEDRPPTIGFVGRVAADKGIDFLREVVALVREEIPGVVVRVAGDVDDADPPSEEARVWLASDAAIQSRSFVEDVSAFLQSIDVLVFPSIREGLPNAVIEAAASEVPTVAWRVTGVVDAVIHEETGYLLTFGDTRGMAECVIDLLANPELRIRMGRAARRLARARFNSREVQNELHSFLTL